MREIPDAVEIPATAAAPWIERLLWVFMMSFAFDYRADQAREAGGGAGLDQLVFLFLAVSSTAGIFFLGWRHLLVRPGAWLILGWGGFLVFMGANALLQGVAPGRSLRILLPLILCLAGIMNAHIAGCAGVRPSKIVAPILTAACINVLWRIFHGFVFKDVTMETARVEVQSSANNWLAAWIGCALLLRSRFHWLLPVAVGVLFFGIFITVTRSLLFPVMASACASSLCFLLGTRWGIYRPFDAVKRLWPAFAIGLLAVVAIVIAAVAQPHQIERWNERLFHHAADRNTKHDISFLTRVAEADAIFEILNREPVHYLHGKGIGASYYWHPSYMPEIRLVYPPDAEIGDDVWFAGHSTWIYSLFSGGAIGLLAHLALIVGTMAASPPEASGQAQTNKGMRSRFAELATAAATSRAAARALGTLSTARSRERTSTMLMPPRFDANKLAESSNCWSTWLKGANKTRAEWPERSSNLSSTGLTGSAVNEAATAICRVGTDVGIGLSGEDQGHEQENQQFSN